MPVLLIASFRKSTERTSDIFRVSWFGLTSTGTQLHRCTHTLQHEVFQIKKNMDKVKINM